jgi:hypothetical protein
MKCRPGDAYLALAESGAIFVTKMSFQYLQRMYAN